MKKRKNQRKLNQSFQMKEIKSTPFKTDELFKIL